MPIKKGAKRTWHAGWPKVTNGEVCALYVRVPRRLYEALRKRGDNMSQVVRDILSEAVAKDK